ncbi:hypothetical protein GYMLUDRAFT_261219 [Collybiopsis luxurians FD-317 M1]|uniref:Uncharacterized protein n=1 Tax=Collybiopsis luxurians FD-317 M1 TaxID=944289 RepID=A0A0D0CEB7_9AGAR|nr:hypothetical protein GYMLUDRAFT_261219 [Collybiopsis luxurians FD-317 M1]
MAPGRRPRRNNQDLIPSKTTYQYLGKSLSMSNPTDRLKLDTATRPSLFPRSRNVTIYGGVFTAGHHHQGVWREISHLSLVHPTKTCLWRHREAKVSSKNIPEIPMHLVRSQYNLRKQDEWTFSIGKAAHCGPEDEQGQVIIQTFVGRRARQLWQSTIDYAQRLVSPNILNIVGTSSGDSEAHYILFGGAQRNNTRRLIASGLRLGERETTMFGTRIVYGIASGLDFLSKINPYLSLANLEIESFDAFSDDLGNTVLAFTPHGEHEEERREGNGCLQPPWLWRDVVDNLQPEVRRDSVVVFNSLITKLFNDANHIIYKEKLDRSDDDLQIESSCGGAGRHKSNSTESSSTRDPSTDDGETIACRREITWTSLGLDLSLPGISETYEDILHSVLPLDRAAIQSSIDLPRRSGQRKSGAIHACDKYRREEIMFTPDAVRNAIVVFEQPSLNEICSQCGQIVISRDPVDSTTDEASSPVLTAETSSGYRTVQMPRFFDDESMASMDVLRSSVGFSRIPSDGNFDSTEFRFGEDLPFNSDLNSPIMDFIHDLDSRPMESSPRLIPSRPVYSPPPDSPPPLVPATISIFQQRPWPTSSATSLPNIPFQSGPIYYQPYPTYPPSYVQHHDPDLHQTYLEEHGQAK